MKKAKQEKNEVIVDPAEIKSDSKKVSKIKYNSKKGGLIKNSQVKSVEINSHTFKLTNLDKIYFPKEKITKRDVLDYYHAISPYLLPYMQGRPQSLNRHPDGINGKSFYQKNVKGKVPRLDHHSQLYK